MAPPGARACNQTVTTLRPALSRLDTKPTTRSGAGTHLASDRLLPRARRDNCADEYKQAALAFRKTLLPDVDQNMMKEVLKMEILRPEDYK